MIFPHYFIIKQMLNQILELRNAHRIKLSVIGFTVIMFSLLIVFFVNMITPYARLTKSSPASTFIELVFCIFVSICLILRLDDAMYKK